MKKFAPLLVAALALTGCVEIEHTGPVKHDIRCVRP